MSKYNFSLDMETDNSNSLILKNIKPGTKVLEFGPAHGRMTKYLKEQLNCEVIIVEQDEEAGNIAKQYAIKSWVGKEFGDIESEYYYWFEDIKKHNIRFDYIIFADVLEHLKQPEEVLNRAKQLLKDDGSVFISIPNIGHNAVLIDLLKGKFEYRDTGILDKTHLRFFTHESLQLFVRNCNLTVVNEYNAVNVVDNTEFKNSYNQMPEEVANYLKHRKYGEVYQFIWELKKSYVEVSIVTPLYNKWNFTKNYLDDVLRLDPTKVEIVLVDNASTDETQEKIQEYLSKYKNIVYIRNTINIGFGKACDVGYSNSKGKYVCFLNNDIRVKSNHEDWIYQLTTNCDDNTIVSPTGGKVDPDNDFQFMYETQDSNQPINYLSGWCIAAQKSVWDRLIEPDSIYKGPFSEQYFCYFEDTHLSFDARKKGINLKMVPVPVVHFGKVSSRQLNTFALYKESKTIFCKNWKRK